MNLRPLVLAVLLAVCSYVSAVAQCEGIDVFVQEMKVVFHRYPDFPASDNEANQALNEIKTNDRNLYQDAVGLAKRYMMLNAQQRGCFQSAFTSTPPVERNEHILLWIAHIGKEIPIDMRSPEFPRGLGIHFDLSQGAANLGTSTEGYSAAARALMAYTFTKGNEPSGGRVRALAGVSTYYHDRDFRVFFNPRIEYRLSDLNLGKLATVGNIKAIIDGNVGETWIVGGGVGAEFGVAGVQVLYQRQGEYANSHLLVGIFVRLLK